MDRIASHRIGPWPLFRSCRRCCRRSSFVCRVTSQTSDPHRPTDRSSTSSSSSSDKGVPGWGGGEPFSVRAPFGPVFPFVDLYISWQHNLLIECLASFTPPLPPSTFPSPVSLPLSIFYCHCEYFSARGFFASTFCIWFDFVSFALLRFSPALFTMFCFSLAPLCTQHTPSPHSSALPLPLFNVLCLRVSSSAKNLNWFVLYCGYVCGCLSAPVSAAAAAPTAAATAAAFAAPLSPCSP